MAKEEAISIEDNPGQIGLMRATLAQLKNRFPTVEFKFIEIGGGAQTILFARFFGEDDVEMDDVIAEIKTLSLLIEPNPRARSPEEEV